MVLNTIRLKTSKLYSFTLMVMLMIFFIGSTNLHKGAKEQDYSDNSQPYQFSLAQWSINKQIKNGETSPYEFARIASELGFTGLEYVNHLYPAYKDTTDRLAAIDRFVEKSKAESEKYSMTNVLIMVDGEGDLASSDSETRSQAIEKHKIWINAAHKLGCSAVRVNLYGEQDPEKWRQNSIESLRKLSDYAADKNINVIVENHGGISSNAVELMKVINGVERENCGTLPDYGNFCISNDGWEGLEKCTNLYDIYLGVEQLMPKAFGLSAKCYDFDDQGQETFIDFGKLAQIVKASGYTGFIGLEYEGSKLSEEEGIIAGLNLLKKVF